MSLETNVGRALFDLADVLQTKVVTSLALYRNENNLRWSDEELKAIAEHVSKHLQSSVTGGVNTILTLIREYKS